MVDLLLNQNGINVVLDNMGQPPLHLAAVKNLTDIMRSSFLNDGINVNQSAEYGVISIASCCQAWAYRCCDAVIRQRGN